ncbi:MAG TPA: CBS domain-containing protein [Blastocatellia bacterium]|nr:CBS domain-containing protein [Blastocatellia bacterium]
MRAYEIMTTDVIAVEPGATVEEIAELLTAHRINSLPVVDGENRVVGIVSKDDLFLKEKCVPFSTLKLPALFNEWVDKGNLIEAYKKARNRTASDVMKTEIVSVDIREDIEEVALLMAVRELASIPVLCGGRLAGIISRSDLIRSMAKAG